MTTPPKSKTQGYDPPYRHFDAPLMQQLRQEAYGEDIGQHSWVTVDELRGDIVRLGVSQASRVLDLGCGPGGPIALIVKETGATGTGVDVSAAAVEAAERRAAALGVEKRLRVFLADMNDPLPLPDRAFDVAVSLDVILHARDRRQVFREVARVLTPGGKFLFTDAAVLTASITNDEVAARSVHGYTQFAPPNFNEQMLAAAALRLLHTEDRTANLLASAQGRLTARSRYRVELEALEGREYFDRHQLYLENVIDLSRRGVLARRMYLCASAAG